ncbi:hypothetical protein K439DRAFT_1614649 [Ramaria rubella]|nr:hypothetical protein K439DRAFT_1614649 [Ramaria rubella]
MAHLRARHQGRGSVRAGGVWGIKGSVPIPAPRSGHAVTHVNAPSFSCLLISIPQVQTRLYFLHSGRKRRQRLLPYTKKTDGESKSHCVCCVSVDETGPGAEVPSIQLRCVEVDESRAPTLASGLKNVNANAAAVACLNAHPPSRAPATHPESLIDTFPPGPSPYLRASHFPTYVATSAGARADHCPIPRIPARFRRRKGRLRHEYLWKARACGDGDVVLIGVGAGEEGAAGRGVAAILKSVLRLEWSQRGKGWGYEGSKSAPAPGSIIEPPSELAPAWTPFSAL